MSKTTEQRADAAITFLQCREKLDQAADECQNAARTLRGLMSDGRSIVVSHQGKIYYIDQRQEVAEVELLFL
jgi:hypothetical protein